MGTTKKVVLGISAALLTGLSFIGYKGYRYANAEHKDITAKVTGFGHETKETLNGKTVEIPFIYTDKDTLLDINHLYRGNFSLTGDFNGKIYKDSTYIFTVEGFRSQSLNTYPNIVDVKPVK